MPGGKRAYTLTAVHDDACGSERMDRARLSFHFH